MSRDITTSILYQKGYRINSRGEWYKPAPELPHPVEEPNIRHGAEGPDARKENSAGRRVRLVITSYRVKLCDIDNLEVKFLVDALRYGKLITNDSPEFVGELSIRQVKVEHFIDEHTTVEL